MKRMMSPVLAAVTVLVVLAVVPAVAGASLVNPGTVAHPEYLGPNLIPGRYSTHAHPIDSNRRTSALTRLCSREGNVPTKRPSCSAKLGTVSYSLYEEENMIMNNRMRKMHAGWVVVLVSLLLCPGCNMASAAKTITDVEKINK